VGDGRRGVRRARRVAPFGVVAGLVELIDHPVGRRRMIQGGFNPDGMSVATAVETLYAVLCKGRESDQAAMIKLHTDLAEIAGMDSGDDMNFEAVTAALGVSEGEIERARQKANDLAAAKAAANPGSTLDVID